MKIHYILCQTTNEEAFVNGPLYKEVAKVLPGNVIPYYKRERIQRKIPSKEQRALILQALRSSRPGDLLIIWGVKVRVFFFIMTQLFFRNRKVLFQNMIFNPDRVQRTWRAKFSYWMYRYAFGTGKFYATVNGEGLSAFYSELFHCSTDKFPVVYDPMELSQDMTDYSPLKKGEGYVFSGGRTERDIETFTQIVKAMPDVKFKCVFKKDMITEEMRSLSNLEIHSGISFDAFYEMLAHSSYCCIPLKSYAPCGLLVMQRAALMGKPIVSTDTFSMKTMIPTDDYGYLCKRGDVVGMVNALRFLINNPTEREKVATRMKSRMRLFSYQSVGGQQAKAVQSIIDKVN